MNIEHLQELWEKQSASLPPLPDDAALLAKIKAESEEFDRTIRRRDRRELLAGLKFGGFFAVLAAIFSGRGVAWPYAAAAGGMAVVILFLLGEKALARMRRSKQSGTLLAELGRARVEVGRQLWLLRHVAWWYVLPAQVAWGFFGLGVLLNFFRPIPTWAVVGLMTVWAWTLWRGAVAVWRLNQQAVKESLEPRLKELDDLAAGFDGETAAGTAGDRPPNAP